MKTAVALIFAAMIMWSCTESPSISSDASDHSSGSLSLAFDKSNAPTAVKTLTVILTRSGYSSFLKNISIHSDTTAVVVFEKVPIGTWNLLIDAKDENGTVLYSGSKDVLVQENIISQVSISLQPVSTGVGTIQIFVTWGENFDKLLIDYLDNPVLTKSEIPSFQTGVTLPKVVFNGTSYIMWFGTTYTKGGVGYASSSNGKIWTNVQATNLTVSENRWDNGRITTGAIIRTNGEYRMYYNAFSQINSNFQCGLAVSSDGIEWEKQPNPVLVPPSWCYSLVTSDIIFLDSMYFMYFSGATINGNRIGLAISQDGINWSHYGSGPILTPTLEWEGTSVYAPSIKKEGEIITMIYMGGKGGMGSGFGEAISTDGINWQKKSSQPIFTQTATSKGVPTDEISYPFQVSIGNEKRIYYNGYDYATSVWTIRFAYYK